MKTVTLAEVAVLLFDPNRERKSKDMERQSNRHLLTSFRTVSYTHLRAHETDSYLVCRLLLEKKKKKKDKKKKK